MESKLVPLLIYQEGSANFEWFACLSVKTPYEASEQVEILDGWFPLFSAKIRLRLVQSCNCLCFLVILSSGPLEVGSFRKSL